MLIHHHYSQKLEFGNSLNRNSTERVTSSSYFKKCHFCQVQRYFTDVLQKETKCIYTRSQLFIHLLSYHTAVAFFFGCLFVLKILHTSVTHWRFNSQQFMSAPLTITSELYYCTTNNNSAAGRYFGMSLFHMYKGDCCSCFMSSVHRTVHCFHT